MNKCPPAPDESCFKMFFRELAVSTSLQVQGKRLVSPYFTTSLKQPFQTNIFPPQTYFHDFPNLISYIDLLFPFFRVPKKSQHGPFAKNFAESTSKSSSLGMAAFCLVEDAARGGFKTPLRHPWGFESFPVTLGVHM